MANKTQKMKKKQKQKQQLLYSILFSEIIYIQMLMMLMKVERRRQETAESRKQKADNAGAGQTQRTLTAASAQQGHRHTAAARHLSPPLSTGTWNYCKSERREQKMPLPLVSCCKYFFAEQDDDDKFVPVCLPLCQLSPFLSLSLSLYLAAPRCVCVMNKFLSARNFTCFAIWLSEVRVLPYLLLPSSLSTSLLTIQIKLLA